MWEEKDRALAGVRQLRRERQGGPTSHRSPQGESQQGLSARAIHSRSGSGRFEETNSRGGLAVTHVLSANTVKARQQAARSELVEWCERLRQQDRERAWKPTSPKHEGERAHLAHSRSSSKHNAGYQGAPSSFTRQTSRASSNAANFTFRAQKLEEEELRARQRLQEESRALAIERRRANPEAHPPGHPSPQAADRRPRPGSARRQAPQAPRAPHAPPPSRSATPAATWAPPKEPPKTLLELAEEVAREGWCEEQEV